MYYGLACYHEHWPETRWPIDAEMMPEAGVAVLKKNVPHG